MYRLEASSVHLEVAGCGLYPGGVGVLPKVLGGGVPHSSQNPDPISDQNIFIYLEALFQT